MSVRLKVFACCLLLFLGISPRKVSAALFTEVFIRPDRTKVGISPGRTLVQLKTSSVAVESFLSFELDPRLVSGTHYASTASTFTTTTTDLPTGVTPLPLVGSTATSLSGHTLTFSIGDLTPGTMYGFYITDGYLLNPSASTYKTIVSTQTSGNSVIDTQNVWTETNANDQITVQATVPSTAANYSVELSGDEVQETNPQGTTLGFTITYGTDTALSSPLTLQASWGLGTAEGQDTPTHPILEYVDGSAGNAYGATTPVIDVHSRTITWSISNFPAGTPTQTVRFSLRTTDTYTGEKKVVVPISAQITAPVQSGVSVLNKTYLYRPVSQTSTTGSTPTPTPIATSPSLTIRSLSSRTDHSVTISMDTVPVGEVVIRYGTSPRRLTSTLRSLATTNSHEITLDTLEANTTYYLQFELIIQGQRVVRSNIYTITTAKPSETQPELIDQTLTFLQDGSPIYGTSGSALSQQIVLLTGEVIDLHLSMQHAEDIRTIQAFLRRSDVLGLTTKDEYEPEVGTTFLTDIGFGRFVGKFRSPSAPGLYTAMIRIETKDGTVSEKNISTVRLILPLRITTHSGAPIENVKATVKRYNTETRLFERLDPTATSIRSTMHSDENGVVPFNLSAGKYQIELTSPGYVSKTIDVSLEYGVKEPYPTVVLESAPFSLGTLTAYYTDIFSTIHTAFTDLLERFSVSKRFWNLTFILLLFTLCALMLLSLSVRFGVPLYMLWYAIPKHMWHLYTIADHSYIHGVIRDAHGAVALSGVSVKLSHHIRGLSTSFCTTNAVGEFALRVPKNHGPLDITVEKTGYQRINLHLSESKDTPVELMLKRTTPHWISSLSAHLGDFFYECIDIGLELYLAIAIACELYLLSVGRIDIFLPFAVLTLACIGMWVIWKKLWNSRMTHWQSL